MPKTDIKVRIIGADGNVFNLLGICRESPRPSREDRTVGRVLQGGDLRRLRPRHRHHCRLVRGLLGK